MSPSSSPARCSYPTGSTAPTSRCRAIEQPRRPSCSACAPPFPSTSRAGRTSPRALASSEPHLPGTACLTDWSWPSAARRSPPERRAGRVTGASSPKDRQRPLVRQTGQGALHCRGDERVARLRIRPGAEALAKVDRLADPDRDLGRQWKAARQVHDRDAERRPEDRGQDLEPEATVQLEGPGEPPALAEEQRGLLSADRDNRDDRDPVLECQLDEAGAVIEIDPVGFPTRAERLVVAARIDEQRRALLEGTGGVGR